MQDPKLVEEIVAALSEHNAEYASIPKFVREFLNDLDTAGYVVIPKFVINAPVQKVISDKTLKELAKNLDDEREYRVREGYEETLIPPRSEYRKFEPLRDRPRPAGPAEGEYVEEDPVVDIAGILRKHDAELQFTEPNQILGNLTSDPGGWVDRTPKTITKTANTVLLVDPEERMLFDASDVTITHTGQKLGEVLTPDEKAIPLIGSVGDASTWRVMTPEERHTWSHLTPSMGQDWDIDANTPIQDEGASEG